MNITDTIEYELRCCIFANSLKQIYNLITAVSNVPSVYCLIDQDLNYRQMVKHSVIALTQPSNISGG